MKAALLIVPLRNWNKFIAMGIKVSVAFNCTTEELKFLLPNGAFKYKTSFNCTTEELKFDNKKLQKTAQKLLIVPLRNWNILYRQGEKPIQPLLIVPLRNWNVIINSSNEAVRTLLIVPLRNWNFHTVFDSKPPSNF